MFSKVFLAQTRREMTDELPDKLAYMALHFSPYSKGLSNLPQELPPNSILLLDDSMPPENHNPQTVTKQLTELVSEFSPAAVLLDFQRPKNAESEAMAIAILQALPCPVGITGIYAKDLSCPVFLPPAPANKALEDHLKPWLEQGVFLEIAPEALKISVTEQGSFTTPIPAVQNLPLEDNRLHCHYNVEVFTEKAVFTLCRYKEDLLSLCLEAEKLGVFGCVGLYEELRNL